MYSKIYKIKLIKIFSLDFNEKKVNNYIEELISIEVIEIKNRSIRKW